MNEQGRAKKSSFTNRQRKYNAVYV